MIGTLDWSQFGITGMFIGYLIYDRTILLKKLIEKFDHHERLFYRMLNKMESIKNR